MTALLAVEFEPQAVPHRAVNALRQPTLAILALDIGRCEVVATVEAENDAGLVAAVKAIGRCPGIRSTTLFAGQPTS